MDRLEAMGILVAVAETGSLSAAGRRFGLLGLAYERVPVDLAGGEHKGPDFLKLNPFGQVPVLDDDGAPEGGVELVLDSPEISTFPGAERLWRVRPRRIVRRRGALPLRWR